VRNIDRGRPVSKSLGIVVTATDQLLENIVRGWASSTAVTVSVAPEGPGAPPAVEVRPSNPRSAPISLWVSDDDENVSALVGEGMDFDAAVPLEAAAVQRLLEAVAAGQVSEYVRKLFGRVVARRGSVGAPNWGLTYREVNPFSIIPGVEWQSLNWMPYAGDK
jgi:hypothetical protein